MTKLHERHSLHYTLQRATSAAPVCMVQSLCPEPCDLTVYASFRSNLQNHCDQRTHNQVTSLLTPHCVRAFNSRADSDRTVEIQNQISRYFRETEFLKDRDRAFDSPIRHIWQHRNLGHSKSQFLSATPPPF